MMDGWKIMCILTSGLAAGVLATFAVCGVLGLPVSRTNSRRSSGIHDRMADCRRSGADHEMGLADSLMQRPAFGHGDLKASD